MKKKKGGEGRGGEWREGEGNGGEGRGEEGEEGSVNHGRSDRSCHHCKSVLPSLV